MDKEEFREVIRCPKCNSEMIEIYQKGFRVGKALVGAVVTGGIGLLAGFIGSKKALAVCLACGKKFDPKEGYLKIRINNPSSEKIIEQEPVDTKIQYIANLSDEDIEKKFKIWDRLYEKGLLNKDELENKKQEYLKSRKNS
jgi:DNA-directed RNA polymerase subunit RPC12/RpoP